MGAPEQPAEGVVRGLKVLVVDDNANMRRLLSTILTAFGAAEVRDVATVDAAYGLLAGWTPDLVLVDYVMDGADGADFTRRVRSEYDRGSDRLPIIVVTGYADTARFNHAKEAGANDFIAKPIDPKTLLRRIGRVMSNRLTIKEMEEFATQLQKTLSEVR